MTATDFSFAEHANIPTVITSYSSLSFTSNCCGIFVEWIWWQLLTTWTTSSLLLVYFCSAWCHGHWKHKYSWWWWCWWWHGWVMYSHTIKHQPQCCTSLSTLLTPLRTTSVLSSTSSRASQRRISIWWGLSLHQKGLLWNPWRLDNSHLQILNLWKWRSDLASFRFQRIFEDIMSTTAGEVFCFNARSTDATTNLGHHT